jgi:hypothetical protein
VLRGASSTCTTSPKFWVGHKPIGLQLSGVGLGRSTRLSLARSVMEEILVIRPFSTVHANRATT